LRFELGLRDEKVSAVFSITPWWSAYVDLKKARERREGDRASQNQLRGPGGD
jgi:hypothetical protein